MLERRTRPCIGAPYRNGARSIAAVFEDLYGYRWDLIQPIPLAGRAPGADLHDRT